MAVTFDEATKSYTDGVTTLELKNGAYEIGTVEQLKLFRDAVNEGNSFAKATVKLTADIDLETRSGLRSARRQMLLRGFSMAAGIPSAIFISISLPGAMSAFSAIPGMVRSGI